MLNKKALKELVNCISGIKKSARITIIKLITNENKPKVIQDNGKDKIFKMGFKKMFKNNKTPIKMKIA